MVKNSFACHISQIFPSESLCRAGHSLSRIKCLFTKQKYMLFIYLSQSSDQMCSNVYITLIYLDHSSTKYAAEQRMIAYVCSGSQKSKKYN